ncbi:MAG: TolC family protein [Chitinophagaceae bacterium]
MSRAKTLFRFCAGVLVVVFTGNGVHAQDSLRITLQQAEEQFLQKNLSLLAEKYNIDIARAEAIQARLYDNPTISVSANLYDPEHKKVFNVSSQNGQYDIALTQVIQLAGKRNKQVKLAETGAAMAENRFFDLLRTLRLTLRSDFYEAYFLQHSIDAYQLQISSLEKLAETYQELQTKGVVTLKDAVRIKSMLYNLRAERTALQNNMHDVQAEMQLLLQNNQAWFIPVTDVPVGSLPLLKNIALRDLIDTAYSNRADLKMAQNNLTYNQQNLQLQKALAVPNLTLGAEFDKRGSFVDNATFLTVAMDLPFFNRNQGNIKGAKSGIEQSKILLQQQTTTVENEVQTAWNKVLNTDKVVSTIDSTFQGDYNKLLQSVTDNFTKRNISLLEFIDFFDSYKENVLHTNDMLNDRMQAIERLNFAVGKNYIHIN